MSILPVVSTPWKSSLKYKADFSLAIRAPKDKINSNELIVLAILILVYLFFHFQGAQILLKINKIPFGTSSL